VTERFGLSATARDILGRLRVAQDAAQLEAAGLSPALLAAMRAEGFLVEQDATVPPADHQDVFGGWQSQKGMLVDDIRTGAFRRAIEALVRPGDRVIDVGTGSGILAMCAARAGAAEVMALEVTAMADWARRLAAHNGLAAVRVLRGDAAAFDAGGPVDLVIGEFAGLTLLDEWRHYAAFVRLRDRFLRPGGAVLPSAGRLFLSAVDDRRLYLERGPGFWEAPVQGFDFSLVRAAEIASPRRYILSALHNAQVATRLLRAFDFRHGRESDYFFAAEIAFAYPAAGMFHGVVAHFELDLAPGLTLATGTAARETCWHQSYFPLPAIAVPAGAEVALRARSFLGPDGVLRLGLAAAAPGASPDEAAEHVFVLE
jgi:hypothetical protein